MYVGVFLSHSAEHNVSICPGISSIQPISASRRINKRVSEGRGEGGSGVVVAEGWHVLCDSYDTSPVFQNRSFTFL